MSSFSDMLTYLRKRENLSQQELAEKTGLTRSAIGMYETGKREPDFETLEKIADFFNVNMDYLIGKSDFKNNTEMFQYWDKQNKAKEFYKEVADIPNTCPIETKRFPLLGKIACGEPVFADEDRESYVEAGTNIQADFCLKAKGDSMINARIYDGDIVFIRKQPDVNDGEIAAVLIDDEATLKRVFKMPGRIQLRAENPKYKPIDITEEQNIKVLVLGKAVAFQSDVI